MPALTRLLVLLSALLSATGLASAEIRVLLGEVPGPLTVQMHGPHRGYVEEGPGFATSYPLDWPLAARGDQLLMDERAIGHSLTLEPADGSFVAWQGKQYRGGLRVVAAQGRLLIVNVLDMEDYLRGVVPSEMQASWPLEALRAQAIAARSYLLASLEPEADYDICATTDCQHYGGVAAEHPRSDQAVADTRGLVLTHSGRVATAYYHSDSGGMLASGAEVFGEAASYLPAQADVSAPSPHRGWQFRLEPGQVAAALAARGLVLGQVTALRVLAYSSSGRVNSAEIIGQAGRAVLSGEELTDLLRGWGFKSTRFKMVSNLLAQGDGWGHGVGMSQYGAKAMAEAGNRYSQILAFYYPETALQQLSISALGR